MLYNFEMRAWNLNQDELPSMILAADARLAAVNFIDDQIWQLNLNSGEPAALSVSTTYGLRAQGMRMFPRITEGDASIADSNKFNTAPVFYRFYPNYALVTCSPFEGIDLAFEYWVPGSNSARGSCAGLQ